MAFTAPYPQKLQLLVVKNFQLIFVALYFYIYELKKCVSDFQNLILNWISRYVQLKSSFSDEKKYQQLNLRHILVEKLPKKVLKAKYYRKILSLAEVGSLESYS